jgi:ketosteroid isomerase-like protein
MAPAEPDGAIREVVDRETRAWDTKDVELLLSVFHPDMVWVWPARYDAVDPVEWKVGMGRFDRGRWSARYRELFETRELVHNHRRTVKVEVAEEGDGGFAVVDIDTLWRDEAGEEDHWLGRTCKIYALVGGEWKMTAQVGALRYETS